MIIHIAIILVCIIAYEILFFFDILKLTKLNISVYKKFFKLLRLKKISDNWKEKVFLNYSKTLFITSIKILSIIILVMLLVMIINKFVDGFYIQIFSLVGFIESVVVILFYTYIKRKINGKV
ncbi:hypothetical protein N9S92_00805 [Candidatus Pelagibacter sp.]|nr:hypothetical protein [Candidatus Pelagibacter sp.]